MNNDLYIMHYGVGHDKGGHSGRYPWGSGERPYGGVNPKTKKSDLFKLNGRKFNDVASDLIVKKKYGDRTDVSEADVAKAKKRVQLALATGEAVVTALAVGAVGGISMQKINEIKTIEDNTKNIVWRGQHYVKKQSNILDYKKWLEEKHPDLVDKTTRIGRYNSEEINRALRRNKDKGPSVHPQFLYDADDVERRINFIKNDIFNSWDINKGYYKVDPNK